MLRGRVNPCMLINKSLFLLSSLIVFVYVVVEVFLVRLE